MTTPRSRTWTFPRVPVTLNRFVRLHWAARHRDLKSWKTWVLATCGKELIVEKRVKLKIAVYRKRRQDHDNARDSVKNLVDALSALGWLHNDSPKWLDLEVTEELGKPERTEVEWEVL